MVLTDDLSLARVTCRWSQCPRCGQESAHRDHDLDAGLKQTLEQDS